MKIDLPTYEEVLEMLGVRAREGSASAMICLERALRREDPVDEVDEVIERILAERADEN